MADRTVYQKGTVRVSTSKVMVGRTSYFHRNIASVRVIKTRQSGHVLLVLIGVVLALACLQNAKDAWFGVVVGIGLIALAYKLGLSRYYIAFDSSSGAVNAFHGPESEMLTIKRKIEEVLESEPARV